MKSNQLNKAFWLCGLLVLSPVALSDKINDQRNAFLLAEKYLAEKNEAEFISVSDSLDDYPLYPHLRYQWLKDQLANTGQILAFLATYKDSRYAPLLRDKWLNYLGENERWSEFVKHYEADENSADDCQYQWALVQTGKQQQALAEAKRLWLSDTATPKTCQPLFSALLNTGQLTPEQLWQRFELAMTNNNTSTASAVLQTLKKPDKSAAEIWLKLHQKPQLINESQYFQDKNEKTGRLFAHTVERMANADLDKAMSIWDNQKSAFPVDTTSAQRVERKFGFALLSKKDNRAYDRLSKIALPDEETRTAKVRAALLEQNWQHVNNALTGLTFAERQEPKWQYWLARAQYEVGDKKQAQATYVTLAKDRSYYGFLAADVVNTPYQIADIPVKLANGELDKLAETPDFKACQEFKLLGRDLEVRRQWQFAIKKLPKDKLLTAAKLAQLWGLNQLAITTLVKADYWDDMALRFPMDYLSEVQTNADKHNLDSAMIYGLMRQESMLDKNAESSAGAKGLMQLMPQTARTIAQTLREPWQSDYDLFKPELNINYGSYYFRDLLNRFASHFAVAGAAYNAGPHRAKKWLPSFRAVPADIWIETIPFKETRKYVSTVLSYAIIYQQRLKKSGLKLKDLLRDVPPGQN
jgi:soluble lytic murein transglycosylase